MAECVDDCTFQFFHSAKFSKLAVKCNQKSEISQILANFVFFLKKRLVFLEKKKYFFFKIEKGGKFAVECVWIDIIS